MIRNNEIIYVQIRALIEVDCQLCTIKLKLILGPMISSFNILNVIPKWMHCMIYAKKKV